MRPSTKLCLRLAGIIMCVRYTYTPCTHQSLPRSPSRRPTTATTKAATSRMRWLAQLPSGAGDNQIYMLFDGSCNLGILMVCSGKNFLQSCMQKLIMWGTTDPMHLYIMCEGLIMQLCLHAGAEGCFRGNLGCERGPGMVYMVDLE